MIPTFASLLLGAIAAQAVSCDDQCKGVEAQILSLIQTDCGKQFLAEQCNGGDDESSDPGDDDDDDAHDGHSHDDDGHDDHDSHDDDGHDDHSHDDDPSGNDTDEPFVGTYYPNWFVYSKHYMGVQKIGTTNESADPQACDPKWTVWPSDLPDIVSKINTLYYAFLDLDVNCYISDNDPAASWYGGSGSEPVWIKMEPHPDACKGAVNDMLGLNAKYPHLKLMLSVGGWTYSKNFSKCAKGGDASFKKMYDSLDYYTGGDFGKDSSKWAGIDFDWEHPSAEGLTNDFDVAVDWPNYAKLVNYFRSRAQGEGRNKFFITSAVGVGDTLDKLLADSASAKSFCSAIDHINLMTYDMHGKWENITGHNAPFCQIDTEGDVRPEVRPLPWSVVDRVSAIAALCGPAKVALGIPNYSPAWTDIPDTDDGLYQTSTASTANIVNWATWSSFSDSDSALVPQGIVHYWDLKAALADSGAGFQVFSKTCPANKGVDVPVKWVYSASKKAFASYEDTETVAAKTQWARKMGLAGFFFWDMSQDKTGEVLDAARSGWGMTKTYPASGTKQCFDASAPDFSKNPDGTDSPYEGCHGGAHKENVQPGEGCGAVKTRAEGQCDGKSAIAVGGYHVGSEGTCVNVCTPRWDNGVLWASDTVYFVCDGEDIQDFGSNDSNNDGDDNQTGGGDCFAHIDWNGPDCAACKSPVGNQCSSTGWTACFPTMDECKVGQH